MSQRKWRLGNHKALADFFEFASTAIQESPITIEIVPEKRSLDQNSMIYALYAEIAKQVEDQSVSDIRRECKLIHGVPILRAYDPKFKEIYDQSIRGHLDYEQKLKAMDYLPVTSLMNKKMAGEFITTVIRAYSQAGIYIQHPGEDYARAA